VTSVLASMASMHSVLVGCLAVTTGAFQLSNPRIGVGPRMDGAQQGGISTTPPLWAATPRRGRRLTCAGAEHFTLAQCHRAAPRTRELRGHSTALRATSAESDAAGDSIHGQPVDGDWLTRLNQKLEGGLGSALLLGSTALSIVLANSVFSGAWLDFWNAPTMIQVGHEALSKKGIINEGLM